MSILRRLLGVVVMIAGIIGLLLSLAGLVGVWMARPVVTTQLTTTMNTLNSSIDTSQQVMAITSQALGSTVKSVDALSEMLSNTATSVKDSRPVLDQVNTLMGETLPSTMKTTTDSLKTAQQAADSLEGAIKSLDAFRTVMSSVPLVGSFVQKPEQTFNPEKPLAESLGELAVTLEDMPQTFSEMAVNLDKADNNLDAIQANLDTMSTSVTGISKSLSEYQAMLGQSQDSMANLRGVLTSTQKNLNRILNGTATALSLFFLWLLIAQIVIFTQGWELYHGTASGMEGGKLVRVVEVDPPAEQPGP